MNEAVRDACIYMGAGAAVVSILANAIKIGEFLSPRIIKPLQAIRGHLQCRLLVFTAPEPFQVLALAGDEISWPGSSYLPVCASKKT